MTAIHLRRRSSSLLRSQPRRNRRSSRPFALSTLPRAPGWCPLSAAWNNCTGWCWPALPLHAFLSGLGSATAQDVAQGLKRLVGRVVGAKHKSASSPQVLVLQDAVTRLQIVLEADLPAEAYQALVALDLSAFRQGPVHYDRQGGRWRSELDEWQQRQAKDPGPA